MKNLYLPILALFLISTTQLSAQYNCAECPLDFQTEADSTGMIYSMITVPELGTNDLGALPLARVCVTVQHSWLSDVFLSLESPDGLNYMLMGDDNNNAGGCAGSESNANVCFTIGSNNPLTAGEGYIEYCSGGAICLEGDYTLTCGDQAVSDLLLATGPAPNCDLNDFNVAGNSVGGDWKLAIGCVCMAGENAVLESWSLEFQIPPAPETIVWPGDTNFDGKVDNVDVLYVAKAMGSTGPARTTNPNVWISQGTENWAQSFENEINYNHADANGDGTVTEADLTVVEMHFGNIHSDGTNTMELEEINSSTSLLVTMPYSGLVPNNTYRMPILLVSDPLVSNGLSGLAFTITVPESYIDINSLSYDFEGSILHEADIRMVRIVDGSYQVSISAPANGLIMDSGKIMNINYTVLQNAPIGQRAEFQLIPDLALTPNEEVLMVSGGTFGTDLVLDVFNVLPKEWAIYPNPVTNHLFVETGSIVADAIEVIATDGKRISTFTPSDVITNIATDQLLSGVYLLKIKNGTDTYFQKFVK